jgi:hypothetical protein
VTSMGERRGADSVLVGQPEGWRQMARLGINWVNVRINLRKIGWGTVEFMHLAQDTAK